MVESLTYSVSQPTREWEWDDATKTRLISVDGEYEVTQDLTYGYWSLWTTEGTYIDSHQVPHALVMLVEPKENKP
jgi:hypothetical protein